MIKARADAARADVALVARGLFESRARAQAAIASGLVRVNGETIRKSSATIAADAQVEAQAPHPWVSRGGLKLAHALEVFQINPHNEKCLDVGSSTGGFSDVLLAHGAAHVTAVDTGRDQFHARLRSDPRIALREETDVRKLSAGETQAPFQLIVVDVSFISLRLVIPALAAFATQDGALVTLVKPQFEVGRGNLGKNGIVTDEAAQQAAVAGVIACLDAHGWSVRGQCDSPVAGGDGNREFLVHAART
ncbi:MAG: TlyA family RNA methyltransferase [Beijerinckiaceae bacterium]